jgi:hypothetical protein
MAMKQGLIFKPIRSTKKVEQPFAVLDIECSQAYPNEPINTAFLGAGFFDGQTYTLHKSIDSLLSLILSDRYRNWLIYAHNGSGYDFLFLLEAIVQRGLKFQCYRTGGRFFLQLRDRELLDSMCVLRGSLRSIAKSLGVSTQKWENLPDDFYQRIETYDWQPYLRDDCKCLYECIDSLRSAVRSLGVNLRPTLASTAMNLFQSQYLKQEIRGLHWSDPIEGQIRESYVGGRSEVFKSQMSFGASWDINSSYPYAMISDVPTNLKFIGLGHAIPEFGFCDAIIDIPPDEHIPPLHFKTTEKLYFPVGSLSGWYTSSELKHCISRYGTNSVKVKRYLTYDHAPIFKSYVTDLYKKRLEAKANDNRPLAEACKLLMNTLYGKHGTNRNREKIVQGQEYYSYPWNNQKALDQIKRHQGMSTTKSRTILVTEYSRENYIYSIPVYLDFASYVLPQISSWITANARLRLQTYLDTAGQGICYCDTDSVYVETDAISTIYKGETGKELGKLKLEQLIAWGFFASPKVYLLATYPENTPKHLALGNIKLKGAAKGLPRDNVDSVRRYIAGEAIEYKRMVGAIEGLKKHGTFSPESHLVTKQAHTHSGKRHPDGRAWNVLELIAKGEKKHGT